MESSTYKPTVPRWSSRWAQGQQFPMSTFSCHIEKQSLSKTFFKPDIVTFFEEANLHGPTIKFTTEIQWDDVLRHSCILRHKIQRKSYPWCNDCGNLPAHISPRVVHWFVKGVWGKCFKFRKNARWTETTDTIWKKNLTIDKVTKF